MKHNLTKNHLILITIYYWPYMDEKIIFCKIKDYFMKYIYQIFLVRTKGITHHAYIYYVSFLPYLWYLMRRRGNVLNIIVIKIKGNLIDV